MAARRSFVGLDVGQVQDFSTIAVLERVELKGEWDAAVFAFKKRALLRLRYLERITLGTPYPEVANRAARVTRSDVIAGECELLVDATGVGRPVVDLLRGAGLGCTVKPAIITGGTSESLTGGFYHVPKRNLITGLQIALQRKDLQIAAGMEYGEALMREMSEMRVKINTHAHEQFGAWREGSHDDLVFAVALACWGARKAYPGDANEIQGYCVGPVW